MDLGNLAGEHIKLIPHASHAPVQRHEYPTLTRSPTDATKDGSPMARYSCASLIVYSLARSFIVR